MACRAADRTVFAQTRIEVEQLAEFQKAQINEYPLMKLVDMYFWNVGVKLKKDEDDRKQKNFFLINLKLFSYNNQQTINFSLVFPLPKPQLISINFH